MNDDDARAPGGDRPWERLPRGTAYPPDLETRTVERLRAEGRFDRPGRRRPVRAAAAGLAALAFSAGWLARGRPAPKVRSSGARFALLLYEGPAFERGDPRERASEYRRWATGLRDSGIAVAGEELADRSLPVPAAPDAGTDRLAGFFLVEAPDLAAAVRIARRCPHVAHGGSVVVRPVVPT